MQIMAALFRTLFHLLLDAAKERVMFVREVHEFFGHSLLEEKLRIEALQFGDGFLELL